MNGLLRQAIASDIPRIQRARHSVRENRLVSMVISDQNVRAAIEDSGRGWVVESDGEIVAFAVGNARSGNIWAVFVDPDHGVSRHSDGRMPMAKPSAARPSGASRRRTAVISRQASLRSWSITGSQTCTT